MLKERINYLCQIKNISRKELVDELITLTHFSNILAGRYLLADDIAKTMAKRLGVPPAYLLMADNCADQELHQIDRLAVAAITQLQIEESMRELQTEANALSLELASNLFLACVLQAQGKTEEFKKLQDQYLLFYLNEFPDSKIETLAPPLQKLFFYYKAQTIRYTDQPDNALFYMLKVIELCVDQTDVWLTLQKSRLELLIYAGQYDAVQEILSECVLRIRKENQLHHLTGMYLISFGFYYKLGMLETSMVELTKAEENLVYMDDGKGRGMSTILNNRILVQTEMGQCAAARETIATFEYLLRNGNTTDTEQEIEISMELYLCGILLKEEDWAQLAILVDKLKAKTMHPDREYVVQFYEGMLAFQAGENETAETLLLALYDIAENGRDYPRLLPICEKLAILSEKSKKYKQATDYYKRICRLLKEE